MKREILPLAAMEKLLKKAGANRVSEEAKEALREFLEDIAQKVSIRAITFSEHSGRRTIKKEDVKLASKEGF